MGAFAWRVHLGAAFLLWIYLLSAADLYLNPIPMLVGSLFPDSDHRRALMGRILPLWLFFRHRGFTHRWYALLLFSAIIAFYDRMWSLSFAIGYGSHLFLDACTASGSFSLGKRKKTKR